MKKTKEALIVGLILLAVPAIAKAFLDIARLEQDNKSMHGMIRATHLDVREIRNYLME